MGGVMRSYLFAILIIFSSTVLAGGPETVYGLSGECQKAIAFDKSMSAASCSKVMVSEWQDGRVGFLFLLQGKGEDSVFIDRKSTRLNSSPLMRISYAVFCLKKKIILLFSFYLF